MSAEIYTSLTWLPPPPSDFQGQCRATETHPTPGATLRALASHALDENQLSRLGRTLMRVAAAGRSLAPLQPFRLGLVGNATLDGLAPALVASAARHGFALECVLADFGQTIQEAVDPASLVNRSKPDAVLLAIDHRGLPLSFQLGEPESERDDVEAALAVIEEIRGGFRTHAGATSIVQTLPPPPESLFGILDRLVPGSPRRLIAALNAAIGDSVSGSADILFDVAGLAETVGLGAWHSPAIWNLAKFPFGEDCLPIYAEHVARLIGAMRGRSRKCLILDLDNTLWGGVIGDDGLEGIRIAQGDATGEAHLDVQRYALALRQRGVVLAVSSKNTDEVARVPFRDHPEMLLKEDHFAVFQANWNDKATNIKAIAQELNLGLDAMVFLDDNPVERGLVRQMIPEVAVPELPEDPALFTRTLAAAGYFESVAFADEDRKRAEMYQSNARRVALSRQAGDVDAYLASLDMEVQFAPFDRTGRARIAQLINKSNQFNLTTRRYTESEVAEAEADLSVFTLQVRLVDRFGDNGMISVIICRALDASTWAIDTWLMSCRVLGRKLEQMVLREILINARRAGVAALVGTYRPTEKNALVINHYEKLGFAKLSGEPGDVTTWGLSTDTDVAAVPMRVVRAGQAVLAQ